MTETPIMVIFEPHPAGKWHWVVKWNSGSHVSSVADTMAHAYAEVLDEMNKGEQPL